MVAQGHWALLVTAPLPPAVIEAQIAAHPGFPAGVTLDVVGYEAGSGEETLCRLIAGADLVLGDFTFTVGLPERVLEHAAKCRLIQQPSVGYQHIDVEAARRLGVPVANTAGANVAAVAEHTIMVALALLKNLVRYHEEMRAGHWAQPLAIDSAELLGKSFAIVGMGRIGKEVAKRARAFEVELLYYSKHRLSAEEEAARGLSFREPEALLAAADVLTLHLPLTAETRDFLNRESLAKMKPTAVLVNAARGEIVDEDALAAALAAGRLGGAAVDVFATEPVMSHNPLLAAPRVLLSPHAAGVTNESRMRILEHVVANLCRVMRGEPPYDLVRIY